MTRRLSVPPRLAVVAVLLLVAACKRSDERATPAPAATTASTNAAAVATAGGDVARVGGDTAIDRRADAGRILGAPGARVWMVMISDFQCPYCKQWHDSTYPAIEREYVRPGKIRLAYVNLPLSSHRHAWPAAETAMCASAQGKFWPVHDGLFATQPRWSRLSDATALFDSIAVAAGVDAAAFRACLRDHATKPLIQADADRAERTGIQSTPSFIIGNQLVEGAYPIDAFRPVLDSAIAAAGAGAR